MNEEGGHVNMEGGQVNRVVETGCFSGWTSESALTLVLQSVRAASLLLLPLSFRSVAAASDMRGTNPSRSPARPDLDLGPTAGSPSYISN